MQSISREESRSVDRIAMREYGISGLVLMENAARGIAAVALAELHARPGLVAVVCGPGNNGGDGFAAARHLSNAGVEVRLHLTVPPDAYAEGSDPAINLRIAQAMDIPLRSDLDVGDAALVLDALFGTGLSREVEGPLRRALETLNAVRAPILAVDLPSGLDADTGAVLGACVRASVTATMVAPKLGFTRGEGPAHVGRVEVVDIGAPAAILRRILAERRPEQDQERGLTPG